MPDPYSALNPLRVGAHSPTSLPTWGPGMPGPSTPQGVGLDSIHSRSASALPRHAKTALRLRDPSPGRGAGK